jgi:F-type H+-transporting ATPase subunit epsilon
MAEKLTLEVVTPDRRVLKTEADMVEIPGRRGELGILPGHAPLLTELAVGEIAYTNEGETERLAVAWGFAEVLPDKVTILAETAERADEIDVERAKAALERNEKRLAEATGTVDVERAEASIRRAETRLSVAQEAEKK